MQTAQKKDNRRVGTYIQRQLPILFTIYFVEKWTQKSRVDIVEFDNSLPVAFDNLLGLLRHGRGNGIVSGRTGGQSGRRLPTELFQLPG